MLRLSGVHFVGYIPENAMHLQQEQVGKGTAW